MKFGGSVGALSDRLIREIPSIILHCVSFTTVWIAPLPSYSLEDGPQLLETFFHNIMPSLLLKENAMC